MSAPSPGERSPTVLEAGRVDGLLLLYRLACITAVASAVFSIVFGIVLWVNFGATWSGGAVYLDDNPHRLVRKDPYNALPTDEPNFVAEKEALASDRSDEALRESLRQEDQKLRDAFLERRARAVYASYLLLACSVVFLISARIAAVLNRRLPQPREQAAKPSAQTRLVNESMFAVVCVAVVCVQIAVLASINSRSVLEELIVEKVRSVDTAAAMSNAEIGIPADINAQGAATPDVSMQDVSAKGTDASDAIAAPALHEAAPETRWPTFRGVAGSGVAPNKVPTTWDVAAGENVAWTCEISLAGKSSPVVWGNRLFVTGADGDTRKVFCIDTDTGQSLWETEAPSTPESVAELNVYEDTGYAAPTPATDGYRVYALFGNGDLCALDFGGRVLWSKSLGIPDSSYGFSASPTLHGGNVIVQYDVGQGENSHISAYRCSDGQVVWTTPREIPNSWSSPIVAEIAGRTQLIACGDPYVIAYDPVDGKELWRCKCLSADVGPSPVAFDRYVLVSNQSPRTTCIDASGSGDVTETHIVWTGNMSPPDTPSPLAFPTEEGWYGGTLASTGFFVCYDPRDVKNNRAVYWELELGEGMANFYSSPGMFGGLVYCFDKSDEEPKAFVFDPAKLPRDEDGKPLTGALDPEVGAPMIVAANPLPEPVVASPAVAGNRLFFRGEKTVYCIEENPL